MKKRITSILLASAIAVLSCGLAACGGGSKAEKPAPAPAAPSEASKAEAAPAATDKEIIIGISIPSREQVFWSMMEEKIVANAKEMGIKMLTADGKLSIDVQYGQVQDFITQKVDAIILCPSSTAGAEAATDLASKAGIPLFCLNIKAEAGYEAFVGTDDKLGGKLAGEYAGKVLAGKGNCAIITYDEIEVCVDRAEGFKEALKAFPDIKIVTESSYSGDASKAANITQDFITQFPDLDLIFAVGDPAAVGAVETIKTAKAGIKVIGYDGNPEAVEGIKADPKVWIADIAQDPAGQTKVMLETIKKFLAGETVEKKILTPPYVLDSDYISKNGL